MDFLSLVVDVWCVGAVDVCLCIKLTAYILLFEAVQNVVSGFVVYSS